MVSSPGRLSICIQCFDPCQGGDVCGNCSALERPGNALDVGTLLKGGDYRLGKFLGQGGVGITYLGWDRIQGRKVAIKEFYPLDFVWRDPSSQTVTLISSNYADNYKICLDRFTLEAEQLESLKLPNGKRHRNIVEYFEYLNGENGTAYIVMEYLGDWTLKDYLDEKWKQLEEMSFEAVMTIMDPVLDALAFVHEAHPTLLHLDVSPRNICITPARTVKLIDFGSAKASIGNVPTHTRVKKVCPGFSAFELYGKDGYTPASDVYSAAATIYYALTQITPPEATDRSSGGSDPLIPLSRSEQLPNHAETAITRALSVLQSQRFQSIREFQTALAGQSTTEANGSNRGLKIQQESIFVTEETPSISQSTQPGSVFQGIKSKPPPPPPPPTLPPAKPPIVSPPPIDRWPAWVVLVLVLLCVCSISALVGAFEFVGATRGTFGLLALISLLTIAGVVNWRNKISASTIDP